MCYFYVSPHTLFITVPYQCTKYYSLILFIIRPDLLLLDEPTNHLSILAVLWLARELSTSETWQDRIIVIVSHDRYFTDLHVHFLSISIVFFQPFLNCFPFFCFSFHVDFSSTRYAQTACTSPGRLVDSHRATETIPLGQDGVRSSKSHSPGSLPSDRMKSPL